MKDLDRAVKRALTAAKLSANELERRSGVSKAIVTRYLQGKRDTNVGTAAKMLRAIGADIVIKLPSRRQRKGV